VIRLVVGDDWQHGLGVKKPARCGHWGTGGRSLFAGCAYRRGNLSVKRLFLSQGEQA